MSRLIGSYIIIIKICSNLLFFLFRKFPKYILTICFLCIFSNTKTIKAESPDLRNEVKKEFKSSKLISNNELENYIIDKGDNLFINFYPAQEFNGFYAVNDEGEIFLPRLNKIYVRGLTTKELKKILEEKYLEFLISPVINVNIAIFRDINIIISGEVGYPGVYNFPAYKSASINNFLQIPKDPLSESRVEGNVPDINSKALKNSSLEQNKLNKPFFTKIEEGNLTTISDVIRKAGGITSLSDLKRVEIIRDIPIGKGGGKKIAIVDLNSFLNKFDKNNDLRLFDGDRIFIPSLNNPIKDQVPKSVLRGLSPRFVKVNVFGRVATTGEFMLPLEGTLSDVIDITGPIKPLSGKVVLIRYNNDGTISKKKIAYSANSPRGSKSNPFIKEGDLITVTNSIFGKTTEVLQEVTSPFIGIYAAKELIEDFGN